MGQAQFHPYCPPGKSTSTYTGCSPHPKRPFQPQAPPCPGQHGAVQLYAVHHTMQRCTQQHRRAAAESPALVEVAHIQGLAHTATARAHNPGVLTAPTSCRGLQLPPEMLSQHLTYLQQVVCAHGWRRAQLLQLCSAPASPGPCAPFPQH